MHARVTTYENVDLALVDEIDRCMRSLERDPFADLPGYTGSITLVARENARLVGPTEPAAPKRVSSPPVGTFS